ncbi:MAG: hypothetical protein JXR97_05515 [Planctomycetes bacterium]|nr:hypothetical protein [Planctomycetota bacterium]
MAILTFILPAGGCLFGGSDEHGEAYLGEGTFWWDDQKKEKLQSYNLPPDPAAPKQKTKPVPVKKVEEKKVDPTVESSAGVIPAAPKK